MAKHRAVAELGRERMVAEHVGVRMIWHFGGPAIAAGVLMACPICQGPFETMTGAYDLCVGCRNVAASELVES